MSEKVIVIKNTLFLFFRMFILLFIGLYTSRLVLEQLGVIDYGIYSLVAGIVVFFTIISNSITTAVQRFLNVNIQNSKLLAIYYFSARKIFFIIGCLVFLVGWILFFLFSYKLNIPEYRQDILSFVVFLSLLSLFFQIIRIPNSALIVANEKMKFIAYISIIEAFLKLIAVYFLFILKGDFLIIYSVLMVVVVIIINIIYEFFVRKSNNNLFKIRNTNNKVIKEMLNFSGWSFLGSSGVVISQQSIALFVNKYFSITLNTSNSLATQVYTVINGFISSFQMAYTPLLMRTYNNKDFEDCENYIIDFSRYSLYLTMIVIVPIYVYLPELLQLWLVKVPQYTLEFSRIYLLILMVETVSAPLWIIANAHGDMAKYQTIIFVLTILNIPLTFLLLESHPAVELILYVKLFISLAVLVFRVFYIKKLINMSFMKYMFNCIIIPAFILFILFVVFGILINYAVFLDSLFNMIFWMVVIFLITLLVIIIFCLNVEEKRFLFKKIRAVLKVKVNE